MAYILVEKSSKHLPGERREVVRDLDGVFHVTDHVPLLEFVLVLYLVWVVPAQHLKDHQAQTPEVHLLPVAGALDHLRSQILRCPAESARLIAL